MLAALACAGAAHAEVLTVSGVYPAGVDRAAALRSLAVERFGGSDGGALTIRVEDALRAVAIDGRPYFTLLARSDVAEGVLRGNATADVTRSRTTQRKEKCLSRDSNDKCTERGKVDVPCERRRIELEVSLRLIARNGDLLHRDDEPETEEVTTCDDDKTTPKSVETVVREMLAKVARRTRLALAPEARSEKIRVLEDRRGLSKVDDDRFRNALRLTKTDAPAACRQWQAISEANPNHPATVFNTGLCAESAGDITAAEQRYRLAAQLTRAGNVRQALDRLSDRGRADEQLRAQAGRR